MFIISFSNPSSENSTTTGWLAACEIWWIPTPQDAQLVKQAHTIRKWSTSQAKLLLKTFVVLIFCQREIVRVKNGAINTFILNTSMFYAFGVEDWDLQIHFGYLFFIPIVDVEPSVVLNFTISWRCFQNVRSTTRMPRIPSARWLKMTSRCWNLNLGRWRCNGAQ